MSVLKATIDRAVIAAGQSGQPYAEILTDISASLGTLIASGGGGRGEKLQRVKRSMEVIAQAIGEL